mmetsp:Transcript_26124/g.62065  ORF Transcript_26124/g.62065 Transcript_26124/m.62065 type:complete len:220 (-) Transcript_26124:118-777(-)
MSHPPPSISTGDDEQLLVENLKQAATLTSKDPGNSSAATASTNSDVRPDPKSLPTTITRSSTSSTLSIGGTDDASGTEAPVSSTTTTHGFVQLFQDRIVIGITQLPSGHIGSWCLCQATQSPIQPQQIEYDISTLLGGSASSGSSSSKSSSMIELYARRITECIIQRRLVPSGPDKMNVLLGLSLSQKQKLELEADRQRFHAVVEFAVSLVKDALQTFL